MPDDHGEELAPNLALYHGSVVDRIDPWKRGRVRVNLPGIAMPTGWCFPLATLGAGDGVGFFSVPKVGAEVGVWFKNGDEDQPFYVAAHWPRNVRIPLAADGASPEEAPDIHVFETEHWALILDDRATRLLTLKDKATGMNAIEIDGVTQGVTIKGTVAVRIEATGAVTIDGATVTIKGRAVLPTGRPI